MWKSIDFRHRAWDTDSEVDTHTGGKGDWWVGYEKRWGPSRFFGVVMDNGRWVVRLELDGKKTRIAMCDNEEDAARLVDLSLVLVRREAPRNFPKAFVEWLETGCDGDVPAELVTAALRRVGRVNVKKTESGGWAEARDALAAAEDEIEKNWDHPWASADLSAALLPRGQRDKPRANWTVAEGSRMENVTFEDGPENVFELALIDVENKQLALAMTLSDDTKTGRETARKKLWRWKCAAAALLGVTLDETPPPLRKPAERTTKEQDALDVATRWAAARAGTVDEELATKYAEALAAIARDCVAKQQTKKKRRR